MKMYDPGVDEAGEKGEETFKVSEEGGVVEGPWASLINVPAGKREGMGESKPVAMDFKVCAAIARDEKELDAGGHQPKPSKF